MPEPVSLHAFGGDPRDCERGARVSASSTRACARERCLHAPGFVHQARACVREAAAAAATQRLAAGPTGAPFPRSKILHGGKQAARLCAVLRASYALLGARSRLRVCLTARPHSDLTKSDIGSRPGQNLTKPYISPGKPDRGVKCVCRIELDAVQTLARSCDREMRTPTRARARDPSISDKNDTQKAAGPDSAHVRECPPLSEPHLRAPVRARAREVTP